MFAVGTKASELGCGHTARCLVHSSWFVVPNYHADEVSPVERSAYQEGGVVFSPYKATNYG